MARLHPRRLFWWLLAGLAALAVLVVGGTFLYIHVIEGPAPAPLSLKSSASSAAASPAAAVPAAATSVAGTWQVGSGSVVGYRVNEVLAGQDNVAVGRTSSVRGSVTISGATATAASFTVQMATVHSDQSQRDAQFDGRIMDVSSYPTGTLRLTAPISLGTLPSAGVVRTYHASAELTLHGQTRKVTFTLEAERTTAGLEVSGSIPVVFAEYGIQNPSFGSFVTTQDHGLLEFLLKFSRA